jgi:hypothetical protein
MDGKLIPTMGGLGGAKLAHVVEEDKFVCIMDLEGDEAMKAVDHRQFMEFDKDTDTKIIEYTNRPDTKIVEVCSIERTEQEIRIVTQYYPDLYPVTIQTENCYFEEDVFYERSKAHTKFVWDLKRASKFYNDVVDEYQRFIEATGLYLQDANGNNILTRTFDDFKLVDIASIQRYEKSVTIDPVGVLLSGKFRWSHYPNLHNYDSVIFKYIPDHAELFPLIVKNIEPRVI